MLNLQLTSVDVEEQQFHLVTERSGVQFTCQRAEELSLQTEEET